jgi:hypothetical protein
MISFKNAVCPHIFFPLHRLDLSWPTVRNIYSLEVAITVAGSARLPTLQRRVHRVRCRREEGLRPQEDETIFA